MSITKKDLLKQVGFLQRRLDQASRRLEEVNQENDRVRDCLESAVNLASDAQNKLNGVRGELAVTQARLNDIESRVVGFLDKEQSDIVKIMGISAVDYAICHLKDLHNNRHLIELTRDYRSH